MSDWIAFFLALLMWVAVLIIAAGVIR